LFSFQWWSNGSQSYSKQGELFPCNRKHISSSPTNIRDRTAAAAAVMVSFAAQLIFFFLPKMKEQEQI